MAEKFPELSAETDNTSAPPSLASLSSEEEELIRYIDDLSVQPQVPMRPRSVAEARQEPEGGNAALRRSVSVQDIPSYFEATEPRNEGASSSGPRANQDDESPRKRKSEEDLRAYEELELSESESDGDQEYSLTSESFPGKVLAITPNFTVIQRSVAKEVRPTGLPHGLDALGLKADVTWIEVYHDINYEVTAEAVSEALSLSKTSGPNDNILAAHLVKVDDLTHEVGERRRQASGAAAEAAATHSPEAARLEEEARRWREYQRRQRHAYRREAVRQCCNLVLEAQAQTVAQREEELREHRKRAQRKAADSKNE